MFTIVKEESVKSLHVGRAQKNHNGEPVEDVGEINGCGGGETASGLKLLNIAFSDASGFCIQS